MTIQIEILLSISLLVVFVSIIIGSIKARNYLSLIIRITTWFLTVIFLINVFNFLKPEENYRGRPSGEIIYIILLYISMILGMTAQYFYYHFEMAKNQRKKFDFGTFIAPFFLSPIVFLPLLAAFQDADVDLSRSVSPRFMTFIVAFENGFFWRYYFDKRKEKTEEQTQ
ncbi:hypothetical protein [Pontibacter harenae]|uniref:hypothetical protein n=1 Tax=Pontibacter harenae TaxID=2894083 RepID=UPI001E30AC88|nr:hypothetical protein [Pontibacter harenae]MCC9168641.1 hypothetical protein [Pontibacter harenae]